MMRSIKTTPPSTLCTPSITPHHHHNPIPLLIKLMMKDKIPPVPPTSHSLLVPFTPFFLLTHNLIFLPTPTAISLPAYRALYARVHADPVFCEMGFGPHFRARKWSDAETEEVIRTRDVGRCWKEKGMGDFAVGLLAGVHQVDGMGRVLKGGFFDGVEWVGYAGVRDATTTSMPERVAGDPELPPWLEMVELRYGVAPEYWGRGVARGAAEAVMQWAVSERGARRFIAETERENERSGRVLEKLGFRLSGTDYWKEPSEVEWERFPG
jgi:RimJ/RimL family protein N-acetyltransferase